MEPVTTTIVRDAVDTATLFSTLDALNGTDAERFRFRAHNRWRMGTDDRSRIDDYFAVDEMGGRDSMTREADGNFAERIVHALASTLTSGVVHTATARGVALSEVTSTVEGEIDLDGVLGLSHEGRSGLERLHVRFELRADASPQQLRDIVQESEARPAMFDLIARGVAVAVVVGPT